jgi:hypothetical protein
MQNPIIKIINADLAYSINKYTNIKKKLLTCNANIYFNKSCLNNANTWGNTWDIISHNINNTVENIMTSHRFNLD